MNISTANSSSVLDINTQATISFALCAVNNLLGVLTNGYILWLIVTGKGGSITNDFFAFNLSVSAILFCLSSILFIIIQHIRTNNAKYLWQLDFLYTSRPLFQGCICVERYLAVVHPVIFLRYKPLRYRAVFCGAVWLVICGSFLVDVFVVEKYIINIAYLFLYFILMFVMLFCCLSVLRALKQPRPGGGTNEEEGLNNRKRRAFKLILIILVSMLVNYVPVMVNMSLSHILDVDASTLSWSICLSIDVISGFVQPLLFIHRAGKLPCFR